MIDRKKFFKNTAYFIILLFLFNYIATKLYWYFSIWWSDMPMHFFGGFCVGLFVLWFLSSGFLLKNSNLELSFNFAVKVILGVFIIGLLWEFFEILFLNIVAQNIFNAFDTISDLFFDLAGGAFAVFYFFIYLYKKIMVV